jgi:hypothetical protein
VTKENHDPVMVIVDKLTKLVMFIPTRTDMDTVETAKKFFNHWYRWFGLPKKIISDRDGTFIRRFWKDLFNVECGSVTLLSLVLSIRVTL